MTGEVEMGELSKWASLMGVIDIERSDVLVETIPYTDKKTGQSKTFDLRTQVGILRRSSLRSTAEQVMECDVALPRDLDHYDPGRYVLSSHTLAVEHGRLQFKRDLVLIPMPSVVSQLIEQDSRR